MSPHTAEPVVLGRSARMREVFDFVRIIADSDSAVLITGESGTGKEMIARLIHDSSARRAQPFVSVTCGVLSDAMIDGELFGRERGAMTLFLDDIDDLPLPLQVKLLRALDGAEDAPIDVRLLAGSKRDLRKLVTAGAFREDLFYRLNVIPIHLPALRDRTEDIPLLVEHFFSQYFRSRGKDPKPLSPAMLEAFVRYPWPGNVRELRNVCERIAQTCICSAVVAGCVPAAILFHQSAKPPAVDRRMLSEEVPPAGTSDGESLDARLAALETHLIASALRAAGGNKSRAAALLQIKRSTLGDRIKKLGLDHLESAETTAH